MYQFKTTCGSHGLGTISKDVREQLGIEKGDAVWLEVVRVGDRKTGKDKYIRGEKE